MTVEERAKALITTMNYAIESGRPDLAFSMLERAIIAIEEAKAKEEREASMQIIREEIGEEQFNNPFSREGETLRRIVVKIRARSEGKKKGK